jgi:hypothetical protein
MTTGMMVQTTSAAVLCEKVAGSTPLDLRCLTSETIDHDAEDDDTDPHAPPEHHHVQVVGLGAQLGNAFGHIEGPVSARCAGPQGSE